MRAILDVSNIVYGGYYGSPNYRIAGFPCGGIRKLLGIINSEISYNDFIICFDGGKTIKKELLPRYKAGRVPNYSVLAQLDLLREILDDCDIPYYWDEQYEADDFIWSAVHFLATVNDHDDVWVYSDDRDLACCISDRVQVKNVTTNGTSIDRRSYETRVVRGEHIPYNTILLYKMLFGDSSDNYNGVTIPGLRFDMLAQLMTENVQPFIDEQKLPASAYMMLEVFEIILDMLPENFDAGMRQQLRDQAKIVFPQLIDITEKGMESFYSDVASSNEPLYRVERRHIKTFGEGDFNRKKFDYYCTLFNLNRCRPERYSRQFTEEAEQFKNTLSMRAKDLASGVMAVERYHSRKSVHADAEVIRNMELPI